MSAQGGAPRHTREEYATALRVIVQLMPGILVPGQAQIIMDIIKNAKADHPDADWPDMGSVTERIARRLPKVTP